MDDLVLCPQCGEDHAYQIIEGMLRAVTTADNYD